MPLPTQIATPSLSVSRAAAVPPHSREVLAAMWHNDGADAYRLARILVEPSDVDDVLGDALVRILAAISRGYGPTSAYLFTVIRNVATGLGGTYSKRVSHADLEDLDLLAASAGRYTDSPEDIVIAMFEAKCAWTAWQSLRPPSRRVLWDAVVQEHDHPQLAAEYGISTNAVACRLARARRELRSAYHAQDAR